MMRTALCPLLALVAGASARAQVAIGGALPMATTSIQNSLGGQLSLQSVSGADGLLVLFWSETCPWATRYEGRVADLAASNPSFGWVLVNSDSTTVPDAEAIGRQIVATYLLDQGGTIAGLFGAASAPEAFLFNRDGILIYRGAIDNSPSSADRASELYLANALESARSGEPVPMPETRAFGCAVRSARR